jgi:hypothetical protein
MDGSANPHPVLTRKQRWARRMVVTHVLIFLFGVGYPLIAKSRQQRDLVEVIEDEEAGFFVAYDQDFSNGVPGPEWLRDVVGDRFFFKPKQIFLYCGNGPYYQVSDQGIYAITQLDSLREIGFGYHSVDGAQFKRLTSLRQLKAIDLGGEWSTEQQLKGKRIIRITYHWLSDDDVAQVKSLSNLKSLALHGTAIGRHGVSAIATLKQLEELDINSRRSDLDDADVGRLATLSNLNSLTFHSTRLSDKGLLQLAALKKLKDLRVDGIAPAEATLARLKAAIPGLDLYCGKAQTSPPEDFIDLPMEGGPFGGGGTGAAGGFGGGAF